MDRLCMHTLTQQDNILTQLVLKHGTSNWSTISKQMKKNYQITKRNGKQCRERWFNQLDHSNQHRKWTNEEDLQLIKAHATLGTKWIDISQHFQGRSDNNVKNHFYSIVRKGIRRMCRYANVRTTSVNVYSIKPSTLSKVMIEGACNSRQGYVEPSETQESELSPFVKYDCRQITQIITSFIFDNIKSQASEVEKQKIIEALNKLMLINSHFYKDSSSSVNSPQSLSDSDKKQIKVQQQGQQQFMPQKIQKISSEQKMQSQDHSEDKEQMEQQQHYGIFSSKRSKINKEGIRTNEQIPLINPIFKSTSEISHRRQDYEDYQMKFASMSLLRGVSQQSMNSNFLLNIEDIMNEENNIELKFYTTPKVKEDNLFNNCLQ